MTNVFQQFLSKKLTVNEFAVLVTVNAKAGKNNTLNTTTTQIAADLNGLSRHAVARALRNLAKKQYINWETLGGGKTSTIEVR